MSAHETQECPCGCRIEWKAFGEIVQYVPLSCPFDNRKIGSILIPGYRYMPMEDWR